MLLGAIDDATSEILALQFRPAEDVHGYVTLFRDVFTAHGLPMAVYGDRLNLLVRNDAHWSVEEQLAGTQAPTHVGRILQNLAIGYIAARSPQAKGRIERLWNTLQDRLVSELRLRGIRTVEAAQAYLAEFITDFNQRFGKPPADRQAVWRRPPRDLALRLGCGYRRVVARDNTVRLGPRVVQLRGARSYARLTVDVRELLDGRVVVLHDEVIRGEAPSPGPVDHRPGGRPSRRTARSAGSYRRTQSARRRSRLGHPGPGDSAPRAGGGSPARGSTIALAIRRAAARATASTTPSGRRRSPSASPRGARHRARARARSTRSRWRRRPACGAVAPAWTRSASAGCRTACAARRDARSRAWSCLPRRGCRGCPRPRRVAATARSIRRPRRVRAGGRARPPTDGRPRPRRGTPCAARRHRRPPRPAMSSASDPRPSKPRSARRRRSALPRARPSEPRPSKP